MISGWWNGSLCWQIIILQDVSSKNREEIKFPVTKLAPEFMNIIFLFLKWQMYASPLFQCSLKTINFYLQSLSFHKLGSHSYHLDRWILSSMCYSDLLIASQSWLSIWCMNDLIISQFFMKMSQLNENCHWSIKRCYPELGKCGFSLS